MDQAQSINCLSKITIESVRQDLKGWRNNKTTHKILRKTMSFLQTCVIQLITLIGSSRLTKLKLVENRIYTNF